MPDLTALSFISSISIGSSSRGQRWPPALGLVLDAFVSKCLKRGLAGLERLSGIPGTLGGALRMNAGAFDAEISDHLLEVECMDFEGNHRFLAKSEVGFAYRQAPVIRDTYILGATFNFPAGAAEKLFMVREDILSRRYEKQPWQYPTAGSVFKRPPGHYTGKLIEDLGLKGARIGRAQISPKHAGIIINLGGAKASDVLGTDSAGSDRGAEELRSQVGIGTGTDRIRGYRKHLDGLATGKTAIQVVPPGNFLFVLLPAKVDHSSIALMREIA